MTNDSSVNTHSAANTTRYGCGDMTWCSAVPVWSWSDMGHSLRKAHRLQPVGLGLILSHQVQEREQEDPDDVHEVPVQPGQLHHALVLPAEAAERRHDQ